MTPVQAIVFDFDGTLVDASEAICGSFNAVLRDHGLAEQPASVLQSKIGRPLLDIFHEAHPEAERAQLQSYVEEYRKLFFPLSAAKTKVIPGVPEALRLLSASHKLAIATSRKGDGALHILRSLGLDALFPVVVGIDDVIHPKPDPEPIWYALERLGVEPNQALMVGDTIDDIAAARHARVLGVGVTTGAFSEKDLRSAGADYVLESVAQLPALLLS